MVLMISILYLIYFDGYCRLVIFFEAVVLENAFAKAFSKTTASKKNFYRACEASEVKLLLSPHVINSKIA